MHDENCEAGLFFMLEIICLFSSIQSIILAIWAHHQLDNIRARHLGTIPYLVKSVVRSEKNIEGPVLLILILSLAFISCSFWGFLRSRSWGNSFRASTIFPGQRLRRRATVPEPRVPWKSASQVGATTALAWTRSRKDSPRMVPKIFSRVKLIEMNRNFGHYTIFCRAVRAQFFEHVSPYGTRGIIV